MKIYKDSSIGQYLIEDVFIFTEKENLNGRIYDRAACEKIVSDYNESIEKNSVLYGNLGHPPADSFIQNLHPSHKITDVSINNETNNLEGKIELLDNQWGNKVRDVILASAAENSKALVVRPRCIGSVNENRIINIDKFISFDILNALDDSFANCYEKPSDIKDI